MSAVAVDLAADPRLLPVPAGWASGMYRETRTESGKLVVRDSQWFRRIIERTAPDAPRPPALAVVAGASVGGDYTPTPVLPGREVGRRPGTTTAGRGVSPGPGPIAPSASQAPMGAQSSVRRDALSDTGAAPSLSAIPAFAAMRSSRDALVVGFDTEYYYLDDGSRCISSYQWAVPVPGAPHLVCQLTIAPLDVGDPRARLSAEGAMEALVRLAGLWRHPLCRYDEAGVPHEAGREWEWHDDLGMAWQGTFEEAVEGSVHGAERAGLLASRTVRPGRQVRYARRADDADWKSGRGLGWRWRRQRIMEYALPITLVSHYGVADLGTFYYNGEPFRVDVLRGLMPIGGGKVITGRWVIPVLAENREAAGHRRRYYPVKLTVRDTKALAPAGLGSLAAIGDLVGQPKVDVTEEELSHMATFSQSDTARWLEYGATDPLVCLEYCTAFSGDGKRVAATLASAAARAVKGVIIGSLGIKGSKEISETEQFKAIYAGERPLDVTLAETEDVMGFRTVTGWTALDGDAEAFQNACAHAYRGGYNGCSEVGYFDVLTRDFDLRGAYLTAAACVQDVDFMHDDGVVEQIVGKRLLTLDDVPDWTTPFVGFVCWDFPPEVKYPTLPATVGSSTVYVRSALNRRQARARARSQGLEDRWELGSGSWVMAPEIRAALLLGAEVWCQIGYRGRVLERDGEPSRCLATAVKSFVEGRAQAAELFGPKSLPALALKEGGNSIYGKTGQDVMASRSWNAWRQEYEETGGSAITSPYHAAQITALVRAVLLMAQNGLESVGRKVVSVTTDGMISDATLAEVEALDLGGLTDLFASARDELLGDPTVWEVKHEQSWLANLTTRGNVSIESGGVTAQNSYRSPLDKHSVEGREHFARLVLGRTGPVPSTAKVPTSFADMSRLPLDKRVDFSMRERTTNLRMDFDLKRRPLLDTMTTDIVPLDGEVYEIVHFDTEPWDHLDECRRAKEVAKGIRCLRTADQWRLWAMRYRRSTSTVRIEDPGSAIVRSIVKGHRTGLWTVPNLTVGTVAERLAWLGSWGFTDRELTPAWWRNLGRADRTGSGYLLPVDELEPFLAMMLAMSVGVVPTDDERWSS